MCSKAETPVMYFSLLRNEHLAPTMLVPWQYMSSRQRPVNGIARSIEKHCMAGARHDSRKPTLTINEACQQYHCEQHV